MRDETLDVKKRLGDARRTPVEALEGELSIEDIIADTEVVVTVDGRRLHQARLGRHVPRAEPRRARRDRDREPQERRRRPQLLRRDDAPVRPVLHQQGPRVPLRAYEIPDSTRQARGTALVNLLQLPPGELVTAVFPVRAFDTDEYLVMVTRRGIIKKTKLAEFENVRRNGLIAIGLDEGDELLAVDLSSGDRDIILATHDGMAIHFNERDVRPMGRPARGVKAMTLAKGDEIVAMDVMEDERNEVLIVTSKAFGKRTPIDEYRHITRGGKGVKAFAKEKEIGYVVDQILVSPEDELLMITAAIRSSASRSARSAAPAARPRACACSGSPRATR